MMFGCSLGWHFSCTLRASVSAAQQAEQLQVSAQVATQRWQRHRLPLLELLRASILAAQQAKQLQVRWLHNGGRDVGFLATMMPTWGAHVVHSSALRSYRGRGQCSIHGAGRGCSQGSLDRPQQLVSALIRCLLAHPAPLTQSVVHRVSLLNVHSCHRHVCRQ